MDWIDTLLIPLIVTFAIAVGVLACGAYVTVFERKLCGRFQVRYGPNRAFKFGLLQPIADAIKAFMKEEIAQVRGQQAHLCARAGHLLRDGDHHIRGHSHRARLEYLRAQCPIAGR